MMAFNEMKTLLAVGAVALLLGLGGCEADSDTVDVGGDSGPTPGSIVDVNDCQVPVGDMLCVLGGPDHPGGLVDELLAEDGPLGPIAGAIDVSALTDTLAFILENDGDLASLVESLIASGQLAEGLQLLLLGDEDGEGGLADILSGLLLPNEEGEGLLALFGEDGIPGLVQALLVDGASSDCQAPLGTLCLIAGDDSDQTGLVDLLLTSDGVLGSLSQTLTGDVTDDVVAVLGDLLESDGSLGDLVQGLFADGQLAEGLQVLLVGDPDEGVQSGLVQALDSLLGGLGDITSNIIGFVQGLFP